MNRIPSGMLMFGAAHFMEGVEVIDPPVGALCLICEEPISKGDTGQLRPVIGPATGFRGYYPYHRECLFLSLGRVGCDLGVCACTNWAGQPTIRAAGLELARRMEGIALDLQLLAEKCASDLN